MPRSNALAGHLPRVSLRGIADPRRKSLLRGTLITLAGLLLAFKLSHFPYNHATYWLLVPLGLACGGVLDSVRCMQRRWNWYHGGVVLCVYMELMVVAMILFFLVYPIWL